MEERVVLVRAQLLSSSGSSTEKRGKLSVLQGQFWPEGGTAGSMAGSRQARRSGAWSTLA